MAEIVLNGVSKRFPDGFEAPLKRNEVMMLARVQNYPNNDASPLCRVEGVKDRTAVSE